MDNKIAVTVDNRVVIYNVLFTLDDKETNKHYVFYSDNSVDDEGNIVIHTSIQDPKTNELIDITDSKEKEMLEKVLKAVEESVKENQQ